MDSEHLLLAVQKEAARQNIVQPVLLQVNIGGEASKGGVAPDGLMALLEQADGMENILVKGLMCIPRRKPSPPPSAAGLPPCAACSTRPRPTAGRKPG